MTALTWNNPASRLYEYGIDRGVLYPSDDVVGYAWPGLVSVEEAVVGGESTPLYYDGTKYLDVIGNDDFQAVLSALSHPPQFNACDGVATIATGLFATQQPRIPFGLSYRTRIGSANSKNLGYKIHVVYNCTASPSPRSYKSMADNSEAEPRAWTIDTVPSDEMLAIKPTAHLIIDSTKSDPDALVAIETILYGGVSTNPHMPDQATFIATMNS
jgi:hypothetical protein